MGVARRRIHLPLVVHFGALLGFVTLTAGSAFGGDILRGGAPAPVNRAPGSSNASAAQAAEARANAKDALARTSRALQSVRDAQAAAQRSAAARAANAGADPNQPGVQLPNVPDGLAPGGLRVDPRVATDPTLWSGAELPTQVEGSGRINVTVKQRAQQALLNWETFNVGRNTSLHFDQSDGGASTSQWTAFNQVNDPTGSPTQILGSITAPGQVYVINQNGIIFGAGSQVNVHTLVASALPINGNLIERGLLNQSSTAQFLLSALPQTGEVPFTPPAAPASGRVGDVTVQPGAVLSAPTTEANVGGRIVLAGANVTNNGTISTPDGQAILAAGLQVGFDAHSSSDASLRGLDTYVGEVADYAGRAENRGLIEALRGNVTITGRNVIQSGAIDSSTSVSLNGRIDLRAEYNASPNPSYDPVGTTRPPFLYGGVSGANTGNVHLGPDSVARVLPEWGSTDKVVGTELALKSQVNARGRTIHLDNGAMVHAPSGNVDFSSGSWDYQGTVREPAFVRDSGQIYIDRDSMINVAGTTDAFTPLLNHILTVTLRSSELADSPLQRGTSFRGGDITVDLRKTGTYNGREWVGTPLANLVGYLGIIERTVDELTVAGGSIQLNSGGSVVA
ncbi:MAG: filamentous hemagglutinin N-terminal domain-containing protein [Verrucomicrobiales bacterium]